MIVIEIKNYMKIIVLIALISLCFFSCTKYSKRYKIAGSFLNDIKNGEYDKAKSMFSKSGYDTSAKQFEDINIFNTRDLLLQYEIPPERKWQSEIDGRNYETIVIPMYEGEGINHKYINIEFIFDCSGYVGDSIIYYEIIRRRK